MQTVLTLSSDDWPRCRFHRSLLWETFLAVRTLIDPVQQRYHTAWLRTVDIPEARAHLPGLIALTPHHGWTPDFLVPPAQAVARTVEAELDEVARYPVDLVAADINRSLESSPTRARRAVLTPMSAAPGAALAQLVAELRYAWSHLVAPFWTPIQTLIDADIAHHSAKITQEGLGAALHGLHPDVTWAKDRITVNRSQDVHIRLAGRGLALLPSAFVWPHVVVVHDRPWAPTLAYPARGIGDLWATPAATSAGLTAVLGRTRALLLDSLDRPETTTALAARHRLSPGTTSTQLANLRAAALITSHRIGKEVRYRRTALGERLVRANRRDHP